MTQSSKIFSLLALLFIGWGLSSCEEIYSGEDDTTPIEMGLVVYPSSYIIIADGEDEAVLTVKFDGINVTDSSVIYMNKKRMKSNRFSTEKSGDYEVFASYKGKVSKTVTIKAANPTLYVDLPEDGQKEKFSDFQRKVLVAEGTGTWCGYCPYMITALEIFRENGSNADKAVIVAMHSGDEFSNAASDAAVAPTAKKGFPHCVFNLNPEIILQNDYPSVTAEKINSMVGMELKEEARVGITAATAVSKDSAVVAVRAAIKIGQEGNYRINAWLIEDGVPEYQSSQWPEFSDNKSTVLIDHMHILRDASCISPIQGKLLNEKGACKKGETVDFFHEFDVIEANISNVANCKIAVIVTATSGTSSTYFVNNIVECKVGDSVPFAYK